MKKENMDIKTKKNKLVIILSIFIIILLGIVVYLVYDKINNKKVNKETKIVTCMSSTTDKESGLYDAHFLSIYEYEVDTDEIVSTTHVNVVELEEEYLDESLYLIKGELNELRKINGVDVDSFKVLDNNVTYVVRENNRIIDRKEEKERLKNNKLFKYDDKIKNNTMSEMLRVNKENFNVCE